VSTEPGQTLRWHEALAYALLGRRCPQLGTQPLPELSRLIVELERERSDMLGPLGERVATARATAHVWPYPVPDDLMRGLPAAQFRAALNDLVGLSGIGAGPRQVRRDRALDPAERVLLHDVPPHHGA